MSSEPVVSKQHKQVMYAIYSTVLLEYLKDNVLHHASIFDAALFLGLYTHKWPDLRKPSLMAHLACSVSLHVSVSVPLSFTSTTTWYYIQYWLLKF